MKIFLDSNFQILKIEDELKDAVVKGSNDFDAMSIFVPTELQTGFYSIYPSYSVRRADNREIGPYAITTNDDTEDGYYGWKAYLKQRDIAVKGPLEITISFVVQKESTSAQIKKNVAKITCNVKDAVEADTDVLIINQDGVESLIDSINEFMTEFSTKADRNNAQQEIVANILNAGHLITHIITPKSTTDGILTSASASGNTNQEKFKPTSKNLLITSRLLSNLVSSLEVDDNNISGHKVEVINYLLNLTKKAKISVNNGEIKFNADTLTGETTTASKELKIDANGVYIDTDRVLTELADGFGIIELDSSLDDGVLTAAQIKEFNKKMCFILYDSNWFYKDYDDGTGEVIYQYIDTYMQSNSEFIVHLEQLSFDTSDYSWTYTSTINNTYNKSKIDELLALKVAYTDIVNNLNSIANNKPLGAAMGRLLKTYIESLQSQVDALNAGQNLADIVADLTALNNLDTSKLQANDKVQVLVDSNHDNASTVYNWTGSAWSYIGKYGQDSYTKSETNTLLATKQNVIDANNKLNIVYIQDSVTGNTHLVGTFIIELSSYNIRQSNQTISINEDTAMRLLTVGATVQLIETNLKQSIWYLENINISSDYTNITVTFASDDEYFTIIIPSASGTRNATVTKIEKRYYTATEVDDLIEDTKDYAESLFATDSEVSNMLQEVFG